MRTELAVFDLDGTLVDTPRGIVGTFHATLESLGAPGRDADAIRATIGLPLEEAFSRLLGVPRADAFVALGVRRYLAFFKDLVLPRARELVFPGVAEGLAELEARGVVLAVATSKFRASAEALLAAARLRERFRLVVGADDVSKPKPDPECGRLLLRRLGAAPERAIMVGDTTHDVLMAKAAGMSSIAVTYGVHAAAELLSAEPTRLAASFDEVVAMIRNLEEPKKCPALA